MSTFDPETFETKFAISDTATDLFMQGDGQFYIKDIAKEIDITPAEVFNYFPNKKSILKFYYASLVIRYEMMIDEIDDFESYTLSEKLSNFAFSNFDMLQEKEAFVEATLSDFILNSFTKTDYEKELERLIKQFLQNDDRISVSSTLVLNSYSYAFLRRQYLELLRFWLNDTSEDKELSMELTDKATAVLEELMYNPVIDKSFDLAKFVNANKKAFINNIPIVKQLCSKIEIR
ncbi:TetR/AcrR family transcriptional regulator [Fodinibius sp.]|uniref:TetR/AcrR family transcriptional regulator n=1 Tax=Fodinibius sp. TaxID=1872440 RepID=UPI002ACE6426|nr:TetR/AcrR family transcriptional regulator [Fodinibius sp.]MDZ7658374.1 TetR/AcrR family transcriptional regulator [Fodinibius sp.]